MNIVCSKCHLQPIEPFGEWEKMICYCGHIIENKPENRLPSKPDSQEPVSTEHE